jgi:hypothetical protein
MQRASSGGAVKLSLSTSVVGVETAAAAGAGASTGAAAKPAMISASNAISGVAMMPPALSMTRTRHRRAASPSTMPLRSTG